MKRGEARMRIYELMANLLIVLVAALGFMRGVEWVIRSSDSLERSSDIYIKISTMIDINTLGWLLIIASIVLFVSVFVRKEAAYVLMVIGGVAAGTIFTFYGIISTEAALLISTYYTMLTLGIYQYVLAGIGVVALWKTTRKK